MISAKVVADSINMHGDRMTSMLITFPRIILAEFNTHRVFSRNTSSSRAIPFEKMLDSVVSNPFIPMAWQKTHKGMQGSEYVTDETEIRKNITAWIHARDAAVKQAELLNSYGVTKQICNRLLEPWQWVTMVVSATEWQNFFDLRCPRYQHQEGKVFRSWKELVSDSFDTGGSRDWVDGLEDHTFLERLKWNKGQAEIHMMALAECMYDALKRSLSKLLGYGEWHIPFGSLIDEYKIIDMYPFDISNELIQKTKAKLSAVMAARTSYTVVGEDQKELSYSRMLEIYDQLIKADPVHASPLEHTAFACEGQHYNLTGFKSLRKILDETKS